MIRNLDTHPSAYVTVRELAEYLRVSHAQVRKWIACERLEVHYLGPRLLRITTRSAAALARDVAQWPPQSLQ